MRLSWKTRLKASCKTIGPLGKESRVTNNNLQSKISLSFWYVMDMNAFLRASRSMHETKDSLMKSSSLDKDSWPKTLRVILSLDPSITSLKINKEPMLKSPKTCYSVLKSLLQILTLKVFLVWSDQSTWSFASSKRTMERSTLINGSFRAYAST